MTEKPMAASSKTSSSTSQAFAGPEDEFLDILGNRGKHDPALGAARDRGFTVAAGGARSLQFLQALCFSDEQTYNTCLTARYRLGLGPFMGTLLAAFISDLQVLGRPASGDAALQKFNGDLLPLPGSDPVETPWRRLLPNAASVHGIVEAADRWPDVMTRDLVVKVLELLAEGLGPGERLVLFCELPDYRGAVGPNLIGHGAVGPDLSPLTRTFKDEWMAAIPIFESLPERVGIVFGFPDLLFPFRLGAEMPPHRRALHFSSAAAPPSENVQRFKPAALAGDYAATRDAFGLEQEARAIARLILHPQTDPMTISVEAPWGKGKSSFLNFVGRALTEIAAERVDAGLGERLTKIRDEATALDRDRVRFARLPDVESEDDRTARLERSREIEETWLAVQERERELWARIDRAAQREVLQVRFNAWRHQDAQHIWAGLVSEVSKAVEKSLPRPRRWIAPLASALRNRASEVVVGVILPSVLAVAVAATLAFLGVRADPKDLAADVPFILKLLVPGSAVVALTAWRLYRVIQPVSQRVLDYVRLPDYRDQLGFQEQVLSDLSFLRDLLRRRHLAWRGGRPRLERRDPRIVVFIDDLDRCPDDKVMEVLQTVNLVLVQGAAADPASSASHGAFVLLAVDTEKIHQAIEHHYEKQGARTADADFAQSYLRKIIQLPYYLPEPPRASRLSLIDGLFTPAARWFAADGPEAPSETTAPQETGAVASWDGFRVARDAIFPPRVQVVTEVEDTPAELDTFYVLGDFVPDNPREMKRLLNVHRFVKILLQRPETPPDEALQRKLVAWLIFCARWEGFVDDVLAHAHSPGVDPDADCLLWLEKTLGRADIRAFRETLEAVVKTTFTAGDLARDGVLAEAAKRTRLLRWTSAAIEAAD